MSGHVGFVIGRFQGFHEAHKNLIETALRMVGESGTVWVLIGDTKAMPDTDNPWFPWEIQRFISAEFPAQVYKSRRLRFEFIEDFPYDDQAWADNVRFKSGMKVGDYLFGHNKDSSSFYLGMFPELNFVPVKPVAEFKDYSGTFVRRHFFNVGVAPFSVPNEAAKDMEAWLLTDEGKRRQKLINNEYERNLLHAKEWYCAGTNKYGAQHVAADALVYAPDSVLAIRRKDNNAMALPGGFVNAGETIYSAAVRELKEEAGLDLKWLHSSRPKIHPYDHPKRSANGRIFTNVVPFKVKKAMPVKAGDDAAEAFWLTWPSFLYSYRRDFHRDHWHLINETLKSEGVKL